MDGGYMGESMSRARRLMAAATACVATLALSPGQAEAYSWGTLTVYESGVGQGAGYGTWNVQGTLSNGDGYLKDYKPTGESIYYYVQTLTSDCNWNCPGRATSLEYKESTRWNGDYWRKWDADTTISPNFTYHAANIKVCEDQRYSPDTCSSNAHMGDY